MNACTIGVSIAVPEPYGSLLQRRRASFGDPHAFAIPTHVTLLPPTQVDSAALPLIAAHLARVAVASQPFELCLGGTDTFRPLSPVVFVKLTKGAEQCAVLQEQVRSGPLQRDLLFPYHPHVTVAHGVSHQALNEAFDQLSGFSAGWVATGFALYEQGVDGVWRLDRDFVFAAPAVPHQSARPEAPSAMPGRGRYG